MAAVVVLSGGCRDEPTTTGANSQPPAVPAPRFAITVETAAAGADVVVAPVDPSDDWFPTERIDDPDFCRQVLGLYLASQYNAEADHASRPPPMLGSYSLEAGKLRFRAAFPLVPGDAYIARFDPTALASDARFGDAPLEERFTAPRQSGDRIEPHLTAIYPTAEKLPANHLKFYLVFDQPMQTGDVFHYFRLDDLTAGGEVTSPFRLTELWSRDGRRLTLWFHPGRQKQGVNLNVDLGPVLVPEHRYRLVVSKSWTSADGVTLAQDIEKVFTAGPPDHSQPLPTEWKLTPPAAATRDPLTCVFPEPLDFALLGSELHVEQVDGKRVSGKVEIPPQETVWRFTPEAPWQAGSYRLAVGAVLEDLAGNSLERPFERDVAQESTSTDKVLYVPFEIGQAPQQP